MALSTSNKFGKITVTETAMQTLASHVAQECYGVVDLVSKRFSDNLSQFVNKTSQGRGVTIQTVDNLVYVELYVVIKVGVNIDAVKKSLSDSVRFSLETFTGMRVKRIHVNVVGIRV